MTSGNGKPKPILMHDYRCRTCGRLLFRAILPAGAEVEIRCTRNSCHSMNVFILPVLQLEPIETIIEVGV